MFYENGDVYFGEWNEDLFEGNGMYIFENGDRYEGELSDGMK